MENEKQEAKGSGYKKFATPRIIGGIVIVFIVLWALSIFFGQPDQPSSKESASPSHDSAMTTPASRHNDLDVQTEETQQASPAGHAKETHTPAPQTATTHETESHDKQPPAKQSTAADHGKPAVQRDTADSHARLAEQYDRKSEHKAATETTAAHQEASHEEKSEERDTHATAKHAEETKSAAESGHPMPDSVHGAAHKPEAKGVAFVKAAIEPLRYELDDRWWGWRPNDLINITDNVESFQMGVLEVTRRTAVALAERISRTGTTDAFDENLEQAMNWFMVKATSYWFPSAESKYRDGLEELEIYLQKLEKGRATFYTRTDNLIPLLASFEDLLGSCDENLVKHANEDGTPISFFVVDDYFYYTRGVASAMATVLEAVHHDFLLTLESRHGTELLHHAVTSCQKAAELNPWLVLDSDLSSIFANHRANMAAPISHARFYLGQLIKTLST